MSDWKTLYVVANKHLWLVYFSLLSDELRPNAVAKQPAATAVLNCTEAPK